MRILPIRLRNGFFAAVKTLADANLRVVRRVVRDTNPDLLLGGAAADELPLVTAIRPRTGARSEDRDRFVVAILGLDRYLRMQRYRQVRLRADRDHDPMAQRIHPRPPPGRDRLLTTPQGGAGERRCVPVAEDRAAPAEPQLASEPRCRGPVSVASRRVF